LPPKRSEDSDEQQTSSLAGYASTVRAMETEVAGRLPDLRRQRTTQAKKDLLRNHRLALDGAKLSITVLSATFGCTA